MTVTGYQEAQGKEGGEGAHLGAGRAHYIFPFFLAILVHLSSLVRILAEEHMALLLPVSSLFIGILGHEHLNPEHDHSSH